MAFTSFDPALSHNVTLSNTNHTAVSSVSVADSGGTCPAADSHSSGRYYFEITQDNKTGANYGVGVGTTTSSLTNMGNSATTGAIAYGSSIWVNGGSSGHTISTGNGNIIGIAVDLDHLKIWFKNISTSSDWNGVPTDNPATNSGGITLSAGTYVPFFTSNSSGAQATINAGATSFSGTVPATFTSGWPIASAPSNNITTIVTGGLEPVLINEDGNKRATAAGAGALLDTVQATPSGGWASTETPDIFAGVGYAGFKGPVGDWTSTEAPDSFAAVGYANIIGVWRSTEAPDAFHALGLIPVKGPWASTEAKDVFHATGIGRGEDGTWISTEAPDIFAAVGAAKITGTFVTTEAADRFLALGAGVTQVRRRRNFFVT
jgi:hypothetical protein